VSSITEKSKQKMIQALDHLKEELKTIRTGRASPSSFENVAIELYGSLSKLRDLAQISSPDARQILITPYDPQTAHAIQKSIEKANMNVKPTVDGTMVRINIPPMDGVTRELMTKLCKKFAEEGKVHIRQIRKDSNDAIKKQKLDKTMSDDTAKAEEKKIQDFTNDYCKKCDELAQQKEKEVMTI
jgi:ribosome recycling factor